MESECLENRFALSHNSMMTLSIPFKSQAQGLPCGPLVKNPPCSAGDIPVPGRSHLPWGNGACEPQLVNPCAAATEPARLEPMLPNKKSHCSEKPCALQLEGSPLSLQLEKAHPHQGTPSTAKNKNNFLQSGEFRWRCTVRVK